MVSEIKAIRIYDEIPGDYYRVLVDGLWPRGFKKETTKVDVWLKEIAPSDELRKWYGHESAKEKEFQTRYEKELQKNEEAVKKLRDITAEHKKVALVYAAKSEVNNATVLKNYLHKNS